ncbi:MarR family transcriptional regulator [bacterium (Candidatus Blackallbacteria) CG17_big_fil_post_rev_8_21_14_2_50_48_46]|uniref:MarR family transcriptional regulator n=1 Tax=bacterium (Candidatus Blackallbacteria) CG17_big_fil_post_rev_8_21_14_2_50_48_46 TaxID=2014261 RepID=A0A2M7FY90_9BACT|nr:MAG: MarR family transcriptional regulator [bacterium (Candidatus Blackallbacteria) CG18_big_fil_WC_8_21_14_2_50_49_26]PIW14132.1 MAG: MarR family transcriptional regulator [bacterium (Candidatus Blackallbacteria) CG17_big_fil_post_rev_8_21_14_2_50_48_46]PIW45862.1 MAG: MarR family transcriptional regulator [bacterium (Candidatus Blackallbacteria) CG13_big_fil_rev_8_21_14_2_50_49_14]
MIADEFALVLEKAKSESVAQLLFKSARLWNTLALTQIQTQQAPLLREAHTRLLPYLDLEGTRITDLAQRLGSSKQAVSQLVHEMESLGMVELQADPHDRRAKRVCFSPQGKKSLLHGLKILKTMEAQLALQMGEAEMQNLLSGLQKLSRILETQM